MEIDTTPLKHTPELDALCDDAKCRISELSVDEVSSMLEAGASMKLIDVRDRDEFEEFRIASALFLSKGWIECKIHNFASKDDKIVLYCGGGNRSALAADNLQKMGYRDVHSMIGGIKGWINSGKSVES